MVSHPENVHLAEATTGKLTFKWSNNNISNEILCPTDYIIISSNCGICPNKTTNMSVTCDIMSIINTKSQFCTFALQTQDCSSISKVAISSSVTVVVKGKLK